MGVAANRNLDEETQILTDAQRAAATDDLISSIPLESKQPETLDESALYHANQVLGARRCKLAEDGESFILRGMTCNLKPYQAIGAAFMKERELGPAPFGGMLA